MRQLLFIACVFAGLSAASVAQTPANLMFEVASVRPSPPPEPNGRVFFGPPRGGPGTADPGQITWANAALRNILMTAYDVQTFLITAPDWLQMERYDIVAKVPAGATKQQVNIMWQNLLKQRFGMVLHHESKELNVDVLTVAKGGSKLKETDLPAEADPFTPVPGSRDMNGFGSILTVFPNATGATGRLAAKGLPSSEIAIRLAAYRRRPVIDRTGLTGRYDFTLEFTLDLTGVSLPPEFPRQSENSASDPGSDVAAAVEKQLGLKLTAGKEKFDAIVVDSARKIPTEN